MTEAKKAEHIVVFITAADEEEASLISRVLLKQRKAACINIVPGISSLFWWQGRIDSAQESLLVVKTKASLLDEITQLDPGERGGYRRIHVVVKLSIISINVLLRQNISHHTI